MRKLVALLIGVLFLALAFTPGWNQSSSGHRGLTNLLAAGEMWVGNPLGIATAVTPSGDWTIGNTGINVVATVNSNQVPQKIFSTPTTVTLGSSTGVINGSSVTMAAPPTSGTYEFSIEAIETTAGGGTCGTQGTVGVVLTWQDADLNVSVPGSSTSNNVMMVLATSTSGATGIGNISASASIGAGAIWTSIPRRFRVLGNGSNPISYAVNQTIASTGTCSPFPAFELRPVLYSLGY
jgi:hypothetical protein